MDIYHNNQRLEHQKVMVHQVNFFACYERCDSNPLLLADRPVTDVAQGWVATVHSNAPMLVPSEAAGSTTLLPSVGDAAGSAQNNECFPYFRKHSHWKTRQSPPP